MISTDRQPSWKDVVSRKRQHWANFKCPSGIRILACIWVAAVLSTGCVSRTPPIAPGVSPTVVSDGFPDVMFTPESSHPPRDGMGSSPTAATTTRRLLSFPSATPMPTAVERTPTAVPSGQAILTTRILARLSAPGVSFSPWQWRYGANLAWSSDNTTLAYPCEEKALCLAQSPNFTPRLLTKTASVTLQPRWSPDGQQIAFLYGRPYLTDNEHKIATIAIVRPDGSNLQDLLPGDLAVTGTGGAVKTINGWLDNRLLTFMAHRGTEAEELYEVDVIAGTLTPLIAWEAGDLISHTVGAVGVNYHWSPDRSMIVVERGLPGRQPCLLLVDAATGQQVSQSPCPNQWFESWDPDSRRFLYGQWSEPYGSSLRDSKPALYVWEMDTNAERLLLPGGWNAVWSPDGRTIAFMLAGNPIFDHDGWIVDTDFVPGRPFALYMGIANVNMREIVTLIPYGVVAVESLEFGRRRPVWSPDGEHLAYWNHRGDLWVMAADGGTRWRLTENLTVYRVLWSPGGDKLALTSSDRIWVIEKPGDRR